MRTGRGQPSEERDARLSMPGSRPSLVEQMTRCIHGGSGANGSYEGTAALEQSAKGNV